MQITREQALAVLQQRLAQRALLRYRPYPWQARFHAEGANKSQRMLRAANRVGKTLCAGSEYAYHLTGRYPEWWIGRRFEKHTLQWTGSPTHEESPEHVHQAPLGRPGANFS